MKLPQLSLRDLFWLVLVCALAVGWWLEGMKRLEAEAGKLQAEADKAKTESVAEQWRMELQSSLRSYQLLQEERTKAAPQPTP